MAVAWLGSAAIAHAQSLTFMLNPTPPDGVVYGYLMTDGTVLYQGGNLTDWWKFAPDAYGSYLNGTWTQVASLPSSYAPYATTGGVLADGRLLLLGGEYLLEGGNLQYEFTNKGAIYDPRANTWTMVPPPPGWGFIGDSPGTVLPEGKFLLGQKFSKRMAAFDPKAMAWIELPSTGKHDINAEEGWTLMPDGSVLTADVSGAPHAERYIATYSPIVGLSAEWITTTYTVQNLKFTWTGSEADPIPYGNGLLYYPAGEIGPAVLRPDGTVFATGGLTTGATAGHTAIYHPAPYLTQTGHWTAGPDFIPGDDAGDEWAVLLPNGHVLVEANTGGSDRDDDRAQLRHLRAKAVGVRMRQSTDRPALAASSSTPLFDLYEFDGESFNLEPIQITGGQIALLLLPSGDVSIGGQALYTSLTGNPAPAWAPVVTEYPRTIVRGHTYQIFGRQFNGLSQANAYGDEFPTPTNYPLVRITNAATGHVLYVRTHDHSTMAVATGARKVWTWFDVPDSIEPGDSVLEVVANGIASRWVAVTVR